MYSKHSSQSGMALLSTMIIVTFMLLSVFTMATINLKESKQVTTYEDSTKVFQAAQGGIEDGLLKVKTSCADSPATEFTLNDVKYDLKITCGNPIIIEATGKGINSKRKLRLEKEMGLWAATSTVGVGVPTARGGFTAIWTGSKMIVWGGWDASGYSNTGGAYDPTTDTWTLIPTTGAPTARADHTAVWTGTKMIVWGGSGTTGPVKSGGIYDPGTNSWTATSLTNAPSARGHHAAVWAGSKMIVWGGSGTAGRLNTGGIFDPSVGPNGSWTSATDTTDPDTPTPRSDPNAFWTESNKMIVFGGIYAFLYTKPGSIYDFATNSWGPPITTVGASEAGNQHVAVWTGSKMIIWGGAIISTGEPEAGGIYDPVANSWTSTSTTEAPSSRNNSTAVWTGTKMIVWGGDDAFGGTNTGGVYDFAADSWLPTSVKEAPTARVDHTAIWTGSKMIVWGGWDYDTGAYFNTGGIYDPNAVKYNLQEVAP